MKPKISAKRINTRYIVITTNMPWGVGVRKVTNTEAKAILKGMDAMINSLRRVIEGKITKARKVV
jgi:hypothetical protein